VGIVDNPLVKTGWTWDIFCRVIDNYGDIGVCWRLAVNLAGRGQTVRLWVDDASALDWMAPGGAPGVEVRPWNQPLQLGDMLPGDVLLEAFGCEVAPEFIAAWAHTARLSGQKPCWINLEYLSAEGFVARCHGLPSPVMSGPGRGLTKHFFYPGFTAATGGLLREPRLWARQAAFAPAHWLAQHGIPAGNERRVALFCYEPPALRELLLALAGGTEQTRLLVTAGRARAAVLACVEHQNGSEPLWNKAGTLSISYLPSLSQVDFDHLLWACDLNFVRGEDSLVRALWAGKPLVWQIYPQSDGAHHAKLGAFLDLIKAPDSLRALHHRWNDLPGGDADPLPLLACQEWQACLADARAAQSQHEDLTSKLLGFVAKNH
jgi:uncharacterized repeat protein (TIGR03837 family)